jgi:RNA polymerase sigma factor (sigma-70 family)
MAEIRQAVPSGNDVREAIEHILRHHAGADGWITLSRREGDRFRQYHYRLEQLLEVLPQWLGPDLYFSQNTFYRPSRKIEYIRQLRSLYVDVDCHLLNFDPEWVIAAMEMELFRTAIPEPNFVIHSGRGLALVWLLQPVPPQALPLWQAVEHYLVQQLTRFGGDAKASDAARILRVAGTINSKSGNPVFVQYRHDYRYVLRDIEREYLPPLRPSKARKTAEEEPAIHRKLYKVYTLHYARLMDLVQLCELRNWHMTGYREVTLFLYRYWSCCFLADPEEALENTLELNRQFTEPLTEQEVIRATRSAEKAWRARNDAEANRIAKENGYPGAGYNISNAKLIEWLNITEDEQRHLQTIISRKIKYERNNQRREKARRAAGKMTREEYLNQAEQRRREAIRLRNEGLTQKQIAERLGINQSQVSRILKKSSS